MDYNFIFPKDLYSEVRIEERYRIWLTIRNGKIENDGEYTEVGAMVRVFDGNMWYTATTNTLEDIQSQLDSLTKIATPDPDIYENEVVKAFEVNQDVIMNFDKEYQYTKELSTSNECKAEMVPLKDKSDFDRIVEVFC